MTLQTLFDELLPTIANAPDEALVAVMAQLAAGSSAVAARLLDGREQTDRRLSAHAEEAALLTVGHIAERLHVPKAHIYELARKGYLPIIRIGKHIRMEASQLDRWILQHRDAALDKPSVVRQGFRTVPREGG